MTYQPVGPKDSAIDDVLRLVPSIFWPRLFDWTPYVSRMDTMASYPATLDVLASLIIYTQPKVIVEAGTYRGHATFAMAEALYLYQRDAHVYTADPADYSVESVLHDMKLTPYATFFQGAFEEMLVTISGDIDFAYIDASASNDPELRTRYLDLVLGRLSTGGLIVVDDASSEEPVGAALRERCNLFLPRHHGLAIFQTK